MPIPDDFERECLYEPSQWYVHDVLEIDVAARRVVGVIDTARLGPLALAQRPIPGHIPHMPGAIAMQVTGTLGNLHAVYLVGLRPSQGWVGYGTHIHGAKFPRMATIGEPVIATATATRCRQMRGTWFIDYEFRFEQSGAPVFESRQTAVWHRAGDGATAPREG